MDKGQVDRIDANHTLLAAGRAIGLLVLEDHIRGCVMNSEDAEATITELSDAIERFTRSVG